MKRTKKKKVGKRRVRPTVSQMRKRRAHKTKLGRPVDISGDVWRCVVRAPRPLIEKYRAAAVAAHISLNQAIVTTLELHAPE